VTILIENILNPSRVANYVAMGGSLGFCLISAGWYGIADTDVVRILHKRKKNAELLTLGALG
jgi:hypothetical protein